jgi:hypothetical protein
MQRHHCLLLFFGAMIKTRIRHMESKKEKPSQEGGKVGYVILWFLGAPVSLLVVMWLFLGNNIFGAG